jgi:hypothetical protein
VTHTEHTFSALDRGEAKLVTMHAVKEYGKGAT